MEMVVSMSILETLLNDFAGVVTEYNRGQYHLTVLIDEGKSFDFIKTLKEKYNFAILTDITAVDFPEREARFEMIYNLLNLRDNFRVIIKTPVSADRFNRFFLKTVSDLFSSAVWYEREVFDMFGIEFENSQDMRRILTDYGFEGHPLRKDFPVTGYVEVIYDDNQKKVVYQKVTLAQEFRNFDFSSPWRGTTYVLPGDEKVKEK